MRISARQIELFQMAYRHRSTRKAAAALNVSQPAISRVVSELEGEMGVALFDRSGRKFEPTAAAHSLYQSVQRHYQGLARIKDAAEQIATGTGGHLRVAAVPAIADTRVAIAAGKLMSDFNSLRIDVDVLNETASIAALRAGRVDCAVVSSDPGDPNLACTRLADIKPIAIVAQSSHLAKLKRISAAKLAEVPQVMLPSGSPFRRAVEQMFDREGVSFRIMAEAATQSAIVNIIAQGSGGAIVDQNVLAATHEVNVVKLSINSDLKWPIRFLTLSASKNLPGLEKLLSTLTMPV